MIKKLGAPIKRNNLYEIVANEIEDIIINNPDMQGEQLPSEQEIADSYDVSRNVVREALKILRERGLIVLKNGEGVFVEFNQNKIISRTIGRMIQLEKLSYNDIYSVRESLEILSCRLAAAHITKDEVSLLYSCCEKMKMNMQNSQKWAAYDLDFHLTIAKITRNELLYNMIKPLTPSFIELFLRASLVPDNCSVGLADHQAIVEALKEGDAEKAGNTMKRHLANSLDNLLQLHPE